MKKILFYFLLLILAVTLAGCGNKFSATQSDNTENNKIAPSASGNIKNTNNNLMSNAYEAADKLEVYYFHRTARCYSCKTIGRFVRETIEQKYSEQLKNGTIDFREINVELPENKKIAEKYQATGSSLYINRIIDSKDNIEQDANVWRLLSDEVQFKSYLENKINSYLGI